MREHHRDVKFTRTRDYYIYNKKLFVSMVVDGVAPCSLRPPTMINWFGFLFE